MISDASRRIREARPFDRMHLASVHRSRLAITPLRDLLLPLSCTRRSRFGLLTYTAFALSVTRALALVKSRTRHWHFPGAEAGCTTRYFVASAAYVFWSSFSCSSTFSTRLFETEENHTWCAVVQREGGELKMALVELQPMDVGSGL